MPKFYCNVFTKLKFDIFDRMTTSSWRLECSGKAIQEHRGCFVLRGVSVCDSTKAARRGISSARKDAVLNQTYVIVVKGSSGIHMVK